VVLQHKENFLSWDNLSKFFDVGDSNNIILNSNPLFYDATLPNITRICGVKTSSVPAVFVGTSTLTMYFRILTNGMVTTESISIWATDGTNFSGAGILQTATGEQTGVKNINGLTKTASTKNDSSAAYFTTGQWTWFKVVMNGTNQKVYYVKNVQIKPNDGDWIEVSAIEDTIVQLGTITELGVVFTVSVGNMADSYVDDLEIVVGEGLPVNNAVIDGSTIKIASTYVRNTIGLHGASCKLAYHDPLHSLSGTVETAHRTVITASETKFNQRLFQGEVTNTDTLTREIVAMGVDKKLARTLAAYDPVYTHGVVEYIDGNTLYKQDTGENVSPVFSSYGTLTNKLIVFIKENPRRYQCGVATIAPVDSGGNGITPDLTAGDIYNLFFAAPKAADADSGVYYRHNTRFYVEMTFTAIIKTSSVLDKATLTTWFSVSNAADTRGTNPPLMELWDYTNSVWRTFTKNEYNNRHSDNSQGIGNSDTAISHDERNTARYEVSLKDDITTGVFADYSSVSSANTYGWKTHTFKIRIDSGDIVTGGTTFKPLIHIWKSQLIVDLDIDQQYQVGLGKIQTVNDHNLVLYGNGSVSWLDEDVRDDGISGGGIDENGQAIGDRYYITDKLSDIATALWSASGIDSILNLSFSVTDEIPDIQNLSGVLILDWIQKVSELIGGIWWIEYTTDPVNTLPTFYFTDTPVDSLVTLTEADFLEPLRQCTYKIDSSQEMSTLKLVANNGLIGSQSITTEHTPDLGLEVVKVSRPDIHTARQLTAWLSKKKLLYTSAWRYFSCRIDYDKANQDYSLMALGKEVTITNNGVVDHQSGTNGRLLLYQIELNRNWSNGYRNIITLIFQRRYT
jgi:hypothetical protein